MITTATQSFNPTLGLLPAPASSELSLPIETISNILKHLDPRSLERASRVLKQWHAAASPRIHYELWEPSLGPRHLARHKRRLQAYPHIASAIRHIQPPRPLSEEEFEDSEVEETLWLKWRDENPGISYQVAPTHLVAAFFAREAKNARLTFARLLLEREGGEGWLKNRAHGTEAAFFDLIQWLPALKTASIWWFERRVKVDDTEDLTLSYIEKVELHGCSPRFERSLKNHWRFSKATFIIN